MATSRRLILTTTRSPSALQRIVVLSGRRRCTITRARWDVDALVDVVEARDASDAIGDLGVEAEPQPVECA